MNRSDRFLRWFDIAASLCGLLLLAPLLLVVAWCVLFFDGRPVLFRQWRVGKGGTMFLMLKFRTMTQCRPGPRVTAANDGRITALGRRLRRLKLDELPQLINVLNGPMSLIGPRPELPRFVNLREPLWKEVLQVKPGITDLASLLYRNEEETLADASDPEDFYRRRILPHKLKLNLKYLAARCWRKDFRLLALTVFYSVFPQIFDRRKIAKVFELSEADLEIVQFVTASRQDMKVRRA